MIGAFWILIFTILIGIILYRGELRHRAKNPPKDDGAVANDSQIEGVIPSSDETKSEDSECCGLHLVCEKESLSPMSSEILYYDDEELDRFKGRDIYSYTPEETEEFRDVLMTLRPEDIAGWARSITLREVPLPPEIKDELFLLVNDLRANTPSS